MKVICINAKSDGNEHQSHFLVEKKIYTVIRECLIEDIYGKTEMGYQLEETPPEYGFPKRKFIPLSEIDEIELLEQREEALLLSSIKQ